MKKRFLAVFLVMVLAVSFVGCGSSDKADDTNAASDTSQKNETSTSDEGTAEDATKETVEAKDESTSTSDKKYAMLLKPVSNEYWMAIQTGVEAWAKENGVIVDVYAAESEDDIVGQLNKMEDIISKEYDGIAIAPLTSVNLISGIIKANEAGVPVANVDEGVDLEQLKKEAGTMVGFVTTDNYLVGQKAGEFICDQIGEGEVAVIEGTAGNVTSANRVAGSTEYINGVEGCKVVASQPGEWDRIKSLDVATNIMQAHPEVKAFYCANDLMALGVLQAVQNVGKENDIIVIGTDATAGAKESIGEDGLVASVGQANADIAIRCIELLIEANENGYTAEPSADVPVEYIDSFLVTKENLEEYQ